MAVGERESSAYVYIGFGAVGAFIVVGSTATVVACIADSDLCREGSILVDVEPMLLTLELPQVVGLVLAIALVAVFGLLVLLPPYIDLVPGRCDLSFKLETTNDVDFDFLCL